MAGCDADATTAIPMIMAMAAPGHHGPLAMMVLSHSWGSVAYFWVVAAG